MLNKMPKQVRHDKDVILNSFQDPILNFDIDLTFGFRSFGPRTLISNFSKKSLHHFLNRADPDQFDILGSLHLLLILLRQQASFKSQP